MPTEYDPRRPRIPAEVAAGVDGARGQVPFNRWVVRALEAALGDSPTGAGPSADKSSGGSGASHAPRSAASPRASEAADYRPEDVRVVNKRTGEVLQVEAAQPAPMPYRCPDSSCGWKGARSPAASCPSHGRRVVEA